MGTARSRDSLPRQLPEEASLGSPLRGGPGRADAGGAPGPEPLESLEDFVGGGPASGSRAGAPRRPAGGCGGEGPAETYRMRFYNFNMANSSSFSSIGELQGPGGRGRFLGVLEEPLADGGQCDVVFATLVETRLESTAWVQEYLSRGKNHLDSILAQNARREGGHHTHSKFRKWMEGLAASYNGNLKSMLAFRSSGFEEDQTGALFGRLTEAKVAGIPVPNPKKAFMGRSVVTHPPTSPGGTGLRFCFVAAHFPIALLAKALEDGDHEASKVALVHTLRKVLRKASRRRLADEHTIFFVQGDLNSRTMLDTEAGEPVDVLHEVLNDDTMQAVIQHELHVPPGRWRELPTEAPDGHEVLDLPVTYKFHEQPKSRGMAHAPGALTLGDVMRCSRRAAARGEGGLAAAAAAHHGGGRAAERAPPRRQGTGRSSATSASDQQQHSTNSIATTNSTDIYRRAMSNVGDEQLCNWGVVFKKHDFRAFRFPACADRVIYWAPDCLADRMSWQLPRGGYEVNYGQFGSDHRPVALEAVLHVAQAPPSRRADEAAQGRVQRTGEESVCSIRSSLEALDRLEPAAPEESDSDADPAELMHEMRTWTSTTPPDARPSPREARAAASTC